MQVDVPEDLLLLVFESLGSIDLLSVACANKCFLRLAHGVIGLRLYPLVSIGNRTSQAERVLCTQCSVVEYWPPNANDVLYLPRIQSSALVSFSCLVNAPMLQEASRIALVTSKITALPKFPALTQLLRLVVSDCPQLTSLSGINQITSLNSLLLRNLPLLQTLDGLENLKHIRVSLEIYECPLLVDVSALTGLKTLGTLTLDEHATVEVQQLRLLAEKRGHCEL